MIGIGCDHGGFKMKEEILLHLKKNGMEYKDYGCYNEHEVDYPVYGEKVALAINSGECDLGIIICGTGIGISLAANNVKGIRAAVCTNEYMARMARAHNNAQIISIGARVVGMGTALGMIDAFLSEEFLVGKHLKRVKMLGG